MKRTIKKRNPVMEAIIKEKRYNKQVAFKNRKKEVERVSAIRMAREVPDDFKEERDDFFSTGGTKK